ncbi:MAG: DUF5667 domain-containing protein [Chloroflexota bacterium]
MNKYEILEICLKELEQGADVDTVLFRRPELADELRPILEAAVKAKAMAVPPPSETVMRRSRARVLQRAAELREQRERKTIFFLPPVRRGWLAPLRRAFVMFAVVAMLFVSGTSLVRASTTTLPGDSLYPVKRTWESLSLFFVFNPEQREALEFEHENERLEELHELIARGRSAKVDFSGYVTRQSGTEWQVSGIPVFLSAETLLPAEPVTVGAAVRVRGQTQGAGVLAQQIELLPPGTRLPEGEKNEQEDEEDAEENDQAEENEPVVPSRTETPTPVSTLTPTATATPAEESIEGTVTSIQNKLIVVNGIVLDLQFAEEIKGTPAVGAFAKAKGYYDKGIFIVKEIEFIAPSFFASPTPLPRNTNTETNDNTNTNDNDNSNTNDNDNDNDDDNDND